MTPPQNESSLQAFAFGWVTRMITIVLEMALPGLGGQWLDSRFGTNYWALVGFVIGFPLGLAHLIYMVKRYGSQTDPHRDSESPSSPKDS